VIVFYSYSHKDKALRDELETHLKILVREGVIEEWHDQQIPPGGDWESAIDSSLESAQVILLLVSANFMASDYCFGKELQSALELHRLGRSVVVPVIVHPCDWQSSPIGTLRALPKGGKPVTTWRNRHEAWNDVARGIRQVVNSLSAAREKPTGPLHEPAYGPLQGMPPLARYFDRSDSTDFAAAVTPLLERARKITLLGTGLNLIQRDTLRWDLFKRAARGECQVEILLADPESPAVEERLIEEELGDVKPPVGRTGLIKRLDALLADWRRLGRPSSIRIKLFTNYPTFALLIIDGDYFFYPYGYVTLGNVSPVLHLSQGAADDHGWIEFLDRHSRLLRASAIDAEVAMEVRKATALTPDLARHLVSFALYFVPPEESPLYRFGTEVLGYDVYRRASVEPPWAEMVGDAAGFGFHLTICDSLYFLNEEEIRYAIAEVEYLATGLEAFELRDLQITRGFPHAAAFALSLKDPSGGIEILHHELVQRVFRRAAASNYSLGLARLDRDPDNLRSSTMLRRYRAPYILGRFRPHFTLLTRVPEEKREQVHGELAERFRQAGCAETIRVERLAVMERSSLVSPWVIRQEIPLDRPRIALQ
jgi:hypothetical protein